MQPSSAFASVRSLAALTNEQTVRIHCILFEGLRARCEELGMREGDLVRFQRATATHLVVERGDGETVRLGRDRARFIQVVSGARKDAAARRPRRMASSG